MMSRRLSETNSTEMCRVQPRCVDDEYAARAIGEAGADPVSHTLQLEWAVDPTVAAAAAARQQPNGAAAEAAAPAQAAAQ